MRAKKVYFGEVTDEKGTLLQYDVGSNLPFRPEYIACITDTVQGTTYYNKANLLCDCIITAIQGSAVLQLDGVKEEKTFVLNRRCEGIFVPRMVWLRIEETSPDAVLLLFGNRDYSESRWIEDYGTFVKMKLERLGRWSKRNQVEDEEWLRIMEKKGMGGGEILK